MSAFAYEGTFGLEWSEFNLGGYTVIFTGFAKSDQVTRILAP